jgi:hypothetical protein
MHAHLPIRADAGQWTALTNISTLDYPYLAGWRADIGGQLIRYQAQRLT